MRTPLGPFHGVYPIYTCEPWFLAGPLTTNRGRCAWSYDIRPSSFSLTTLSCKYDSPSSVLCIPPIVVHIHLVIVVAVSMTCYVTNSWILLTPRHSSSSYSCR